MDETRKKSAEKVAEMGFDACCQISEMEDKVYAKFEKAEETRRASRRQAANILSEEKYKVGEVGLLAS